MTDSVSLAIHLRERFSGVLVKCQEVLDEVTIVLHSLDLAATCVALRDEPAFEFKQLIDVTVVDYLTYGEAEWETQSATSQGFDRGVAVVASGAVSSSLGSCTHPPVGPLHVAERLDTTPDHRQRFAVVYHLLSLTNNQRLRIKIFL
ncbi:MAG: hypothetical protein V4496_02790, partial [Pseudomonadota bacterium]